MNNQISIPDFSFENKFYLENPLEIIKKEEIKYLEEDEIKEFLKHKIVFNKKLIFKNQSEYREYINSLAGLLKSLELNHIPTIFFENCSIIISCKKRDNQFLISFEELAGISFKNCQIYFIE